jgi:hypothetical protein
VKFGSKEPSLRSLRSCWSLPSYEYVLFLLRLFCPLLKFYVKLHFLFAVSHYYSQLVRHHSCHYHYPPQRILLVPTSNHDHINEVDESARDVEMVYAPIPKSSLPKELQDKATEAWVSTTSHGHHHHGRHHRHSRCHRSSRDRTGRIRLNIMPDEGLLPPYDSPDTDFRA